MKKIFFFITSMVIPIATIVAQEQNYVNNEVLVQLEKNYSAKQLIANTKSSLFTLKEPDLI